MNIEQPDNEQLREWWLAVVESNAACLGHIHSALFPGLYNYGLKLLGDDSLAQDALQELFIKVWNKRRQIGELEKVKPYFFTAFRRQILNQLRDLKLKQLKIKLYQQPDIGFSQEEIVIRKEEDQQLRSTIAKLLNELPPRQKEVIYLHYFEGLSLQQIADVLGINHQSVMNIRQRALVKLRSMHLLELFFAFCWLYQENKWIFFGKQ